MANDTNLYRTYIIRCPRGLDPLTKPYLLKRSGTDYQLYAGVQALLGALEEELAPIAPERNKYSLRGIGDGIRDFVKRSVR